MSYFRYEDKQIYYEESGEGTPLVLLHGNTACGKMFDPVVPALSEKYRVIVPDFLGNGRSDRLDKWPSDLWFEWAKQVKALCDHLGLKKVKLIGSSGGAIVALNVALEAPDLVKKVIGHRPVLMMDDVLSELDSGRQNYLLSTIGGIQTFITCTGLDEFVNNRFKIDQVFRIENGACVEKSDIQN